MEFDRVDVIEKEWIDQGKKMDIDYIWLAHGKYIRENPDFNIEITPSKDTPHKYGFYETRKVISEFYNTYIFNKKISFLLLIVVSLEDVQMALKLL